VQILKKGSRRVNGEKERKQGEFTADQASQAPHIPLEDNPSSSFMIFRSALLRASPWSFLTFLP
jgi:hypothetical protein